MVFSGIVTALIGLLCCAPGWLLARGFAARPGQRAACAALSLILILLITALAGAFANLTIGISIPAWSIIPAAGAALAAAISVRKVPHSKAQSDAPFEWQALFFAAAFAAFGLMTHWLGVVEQSDGSLAVHAWFNADWFKHLGHVSALANYGVPAKDIFHGGEPLYYYWLFYLLPGAVTALGGSPWAALIASNILCTGLLAALLYYAVRIVCTHRSLALIIALCAVFVCAPVIYVGYVFSLESMREVMTMADPPKGPPLLAMAQYIPQHALAVIGYLAWLVTYQPGGKIPPVLKWLSLIALASIMTISILLGAMLLCAYGLHRLWDGRLKAVPELVIMAVLSVLFVAALGVLNIGNPGSAIESPLLTDIANPQPLLLRILTDIAKLVGGLGLPFILGMVALVKWSPKTANDRFAVIACAALFAACFICAIAGEALLSDRLAKEMLIRAINLPPIGLALLAGAIMAVSWEKGGTPRKLTAATLALLVVAALPSTIFRTIWHGKIGDDYTTIIPGDDRQVLAALRAQSDPKAHVWQYPEPPFLNAVSGRDNWTAIIAGRTVPASLRATHYQAAAPMIAQTAAFFEGQSTDIPDSVDWVYLSRALHPQTYDALAARMAANPAWQKRVCYADACLFTRSAGPAK